MEYGSEKIFYEKSPMVSSLVYREENCWDD